VTSLVCRIARLAEPPLAIQPSHLRMGALAFGVLISYLHHFQKSRLDEFCRRPRTLLIMGLELAFIGIILGRFTAIGYTIGLTLVFLGFGCVLLHAVYSPAGSGPMYAIVCRIGFYSYSIYLWHEAVNYTWLWLLDHLLHGGYPVLLHASLYILTSIVWGVVMAKLVEIPVLKLREGKFPSHAWGHKTVHG
jgi:peptidoglycan/LPS O-acetylase OafA/YrhL